MAEKTDKDGTLVSASRATAKDGGTVYYLVGRMGGRIIARMFVPGMLKYRRADTILRRRTPDRDAAGERELLALMADPEGFEALADLAGPGSGLTVSDKGVLMLDGERAGGPVAALARQAYEGHLAKGALRTYLDDLRTLRRESPDAYEGLGLFLMRERSVEGPDARLLDNEGRLLGWYWVSISDYRYFPVERQRITLEGRDMLPWEDRGDGVRLQVGMRFSVPRSAMVLKPYYDMNVLRIEPGDEIMRSTAYDLALRVAYKASDVVSVPRRRMHQYGGSTGLRLWTGHSGPVVCAFQIDGALDAEGAFVHDIPRIKPKTEVQE